MITPILTTKLHIPTSSSNVIPRSRLFQILDNGLEHKLILVSASAGFGKTTIITSWLAIQNNPVAWIALDENDSDVTRFLMYMIAVLQTVEPTIGQHVMSVLQSAQAPPVETVLTLLINDITTFGQKILLVLDDYHSIDAPEIDKALTFLIDHLPNNMTLVITTREDPQLPLAKYRARAELTELRADELRFTNDEMVIFLNQIMGLDLTTDAIKALEKRTEGWIASLQMVAISLQRQTDKVQFIETFTGSHRYILDYLLEEVLQQQPEETRTFLLQTSILTRFNADLCGAVTETQGSQLVLERLEISNLFIVPLDNIRRWYRYHHLFADALQARLKREARDVFLEVHKRAAQWYENNAYMLDAIRHAFLAEDDNLAARLLELVWSEMDLSYQSTQWFKWVNELPKEIILTRPVMCLAYGWAFINQGNFEAGERYLQIAENFLNPEVEGIIVHDMQQWKMLPASITSARAYIAMATGQVDDMIQLAKQSLELSIDTTHASHRQASALLGFASWAKGDLQMADKALKDFMFAMREMGNHSDATSLTAYLGDLRIQLGRLDDAYDVYQDALRLINDDFKPLGTEELYRGSAELHLELGHLDDCRKYLDISKSLGKQVAILTWEQRYYVTEAQYHIMLGEYDTALERFDLAEEHYLQTAMPDIRPISAQKARIWILQGRLDEVENWAKQQAIAQADYHYLKEYEHITLARYYLTQYRQSKHLDQYNKVVELLAQLQSEAEIGLRLRSVIEILVLQAELSSLEGDLESALSILNQALDLAEPQGYVALFIIEDDDAKFLLQQSAHPYAKHLLVTSPNTSTRIEVNPQAGLLDALSEREIDVLQQMAQGFTNPEIAEQLYISKHTVKVHTRNIYSKLDVNNRTQAVTKARSLGIISE